MSESVLDHGYTPEEHAPDPVISHGDPTPPGKVGIWMFLASEIMFFMGILGSYIILRSNQHELFARHAEALSKPLAGLNTLVLIFSSLTMALSVDASQRGDRKKVIIGLFITLMCACGFLAIKTVEYTSKYYHHTIVARDASDGRTYVYDGHEKAHDDTSITLQADRKELVPGVPFDIHLVSEMDVKGEPEGTEPHVAEARPERTAGEPMYKINRADIAQDTRYGPSKNLFYGCYFTLTGIHGLHVIGGIIPIFFLLVQAARGKLFPAQTEYIGLYWHFVDLVWIFLFPLLYLI
ncbi:MAG TPA: cytochrome c oxidase subunit 3 [Tepidisphaeraceae bacterium]|nr:cytochrome c oxidase subunit 3 [Tepidisphaeraceae bacterium]